MSQSSNNETIVKRVIAKSVLKLAFPAYDIAIHQKLTDTCGEFGYVNEWSKNEPIVKDWINNNRKNIEYIVKMYVEQYASNQISNLVDWVEKHLVDTINNIVKSCQMPNMGLAQCLAENGLLPMYGMPSSSRMFYHGYDKKSDDILSIDRPMEQSITEFAPGAIKSKDPGNYRSDGLTVSPGTRKIKDLAAITPDERKQWDALENMYCMTKTGDKIDSIDPYIGADHFNDSLYDDSHRIRVVIPKAYRAAKLEGNDGDLGGNNDRGNYSQATLWAMEGYPVTSKTIVGNVELSHWHSDGIHVCGVCFIYDNMGQLFEGQQE